MSERVTIFGAGTMGVAVAAALLIKGVRVELLESQEAVRASAPERVRGHFHQAVLMGGVSPQLLPSLGSLVVSSAHNPELNPVLIIEAVTERLEPKILVMKEAQTWGGPDTPIATMTSAIPVDELATGLLIPERVLGVHFMNPPTLIKTVEVIRGPHTRGSVSTHVQFLLKGWGFDPIEVKDGPGFVINRILQQSINEASKVLADGIASAEDIDRLFRLCLGHKSGPLETADIIGLDNVVDTLNVLYEQTSSASYMPSGRLIELVAQGKLGRKTGSGFYEYADKRVSQQSAHGESKEREVLTHEQSNQ